MPIQQGGLMNNLRILIHTCQGNKTRSAPWSGVSVILDWRDGDCMLGDEMLARLNVVSSWSDAIVHDTLNMSHGNITRTCALAIWMPRSSWRVARSDLKIVYKPGLIVTRLCGSHRKTDSSPEALAVHWKTIWSSSMWFLMLTNPGRRTKQKDEGKRIKTGNRFISYIGSWSCRETRVAAPRELTTWDALSS